MNAFFSRAISLIVLAAISQPCIAQDTQRRLSPETPAAAFLPEKTANHPASSISRAISLIVLAAISQPCIAQDTQRRLSPETPAAAFLPEKTANHPASSI